MGSPGIFPPMSPLRLQQLLEAKGLTPHALAKRCEGEISMATVYRLVDGTTERLSPRTIEALCRALEVSPNELLGWRPKR